MKLLRKFMLLIVSLTWICSNGQDIRTTENLKDTLFFELDENYFKKGKYEEDLLFIKDALIDKGSSEIFIFKIMEIVNDITHPEKIGDFQMYIRRTKFYDTKKKINKLNDYQLASYLQNNVIYLVDLSCTPPIYLRVYPLTQIE